MKKQFLILFAFISVLALSQVPQRFNKVIVTGDITSPKFIKTGSTSDSVLLGNGSARSVNSLKTDTVSLSNRINAKATGNGTANGTNTGDETLTSIKTKLGITTLSGANTGDQTTVSGNAGTATKLQTSRTINGVAFDGTQNITVNAVDATPRVASSLLRAANGVATLDANGIILITQLPSYIDDVLEYDNLSAFPDVGETGKIYVAKDINKTYRWAGSVYVYITSGAVDSVNGLTGVVSLSKSDIGLSNVDNTSDANKPISTATQTALNGKQVAGTYSTDIHSNIIALDAVSNTNTGDETLTSIKTKLGAATSVSDGYLKYQDFALLHTPTTVTAANGLSISGQNISLQNASLSQSGALTFNDYNKFDSKEPAITKNSGFNLPLGTTPGTVLEGRTFGTAANSAVGDFIQNQNSSPQSANMWINGSIFSNILNVGSTANTNSTYRGTFILSNEAIDGPNTIGGIELISSLSNNGYGAKIYTDNSADQIGIATRFNSGIWTEALKISLASCEATFASTVNATGYLLNGNNLTSSLATNYIPKWNGSSFVNSLISDDGSNVGIGTTTRDNGKLVILKNSVYNSYIGAGLSIQSNTANAYTELQLGADDNVNIGYIQTLQKNTSYLTRSLSLNPNGGNVQIGYGIDQGYKLAVNGTGRFSSSVTAASFIGSGSNLTGVQLPITLTTNGTSGAATFENGVMNVPNYASNGGVNQTQTTVNGSTSGSAICAMPFQTGSYKKVMIRFSSLSGNASYSYPTVFTTQPSISSIYQQVGTPGTYTTGGAGASAFTITGASGLSGWIFIEGY